MASEYEKVKDIMKELRGIKGGQHTNGGLSFERWRGRCQFADDYADRFEAAHQREVAELEREVAELRECLKETMVIAIAEYHYHSCCKHVKCGEIERCKTCKVVRWRKALKGARND